MICLATDTTNERLTVVLEKNGTAFSRVIEVGKSGHSSILMPTIDDVMRESGTKPDELDAVCSVVGPGSFTGIRIGVSAMTAIAYATGVKRIAITSFELIAYNVPKLTAAVDAGHGNVYAAECENGNVIQTRFIAADQAAECGADKFVYQPVCKSEDALLGVVRNKLAREEYVDVIEPFYMRKSQAEREKDEI